MKKLAIISTHPIQYHAPWFRMLAESGEVQLKVFYTRQPEAYAYDKGFQQVVEWDIPLLEGYDYHFTSQNRITRILEIADWSPDVILVFGWSPAGHLNILRHFKGKIPVWFRGDSTLLDEKPGLRQWLRRRFLRWVYRHVDLAFYVGSANKAYYLAHGLEENQLVFAPHAIDNERFNSFDEKFVSDWRLKLGIPQDEPAVLFAGKLEPKKNPEILLRAILELNQTNQKTIHLIFAGNGILEDHLRQLAKGKPFVHFLGFQNQKSMPAVYRLGDIVCLPSAYNETWGLAVNEAMACGRPVITSDKVGCAKDLIFPEVNGYIFETNQLDNLINALKECINKNNYIRMGFHSSQIIQKWSFPNICKVMTEQLDKTP
jgi:glycosyltransferase involved in cell wall biosynthesis